MWTSNKTGHVIWTEHFPVFIFYIGALTSSLLILCASWLTHCPPSLLLVLSSSFSLFISLSEYSFYLLYTLSSLFRTFRSLPLITLTCCTSFPALSLCLASTSHIPLCPSLCLSLWFTKGEMHCSIGFSGTATSKTHVRELQNKYVVVEVVMIILKQHEGKHLRSLKATHVWVQLGLWNCVKLRGTAAERIETLGVTFL